MLGTRRVHRQKAVALFRARCLDAQLRVQISSRARSEWLRSRLLDCQERLYALDAYAEKTWNLESRQLSAYLGAIYRSLAAIPHVSARHRSSYMAVIEEYADVELGIRAGRVPSELPMDRFYSRKACDIRIFRNIVYLVSGEVAPAVEVDQWHQFDILSEVLDDVADVSEDLNTFNGNRLVFRMADVGLDVALREYDAFLRTGWHLLHVSLSRGQGAFASIMAADDLVGAGPVDAGSQHRGPSWTCSRMSKSPHRSPWYALAGA